MTGGCHDKYIYDNPKCLLSQPFVVDYPISGTQVSTIDNARVSSGNHVCSMHSDTCMNPQPRILSHSMREKPLV